jgi:hypothetical protein
MSMLPAATLETSSRLRVPTLSEDTFGIPPFADFDVTTFEKAFTNFAVDGTPVSKFMSDFGPFSVVLNYDGAKYERPFSRAEILNQVAILEKTAVIQSVPRVIRKSTAPKVTFPPLRVPSLKRHLCRLRHQIIL